MRNEWLAELSAHLDQTDGDADRAAVLDPGMLDLAQRLAAVLGDDEGDLPAWHILGRFHGQRDWAIYSAGEDGWAADNETMLAAFTRCFVGGMDVPDALRAAVAARAAGVALELYADAAQATDAAPLSAVARLWQRILAVTAIDDPSRASYLANLGLAVRDRFWRSGDLADLDAAITVGRQAIETAADDDAELPAIILDVARALLTRFGQVGDGADLDAAVTAFRQALDALPDGDPGTPRYLGDYGGSLLARFRFRGDRADLDGGISACLRAAGAVDADEDTVHAALASAGGGLAERFEWAGDPADVDQGIDAFRRALGLGPDCLPCLSGLGSALAARFRHAGAARDLDEAVAVCRRAAGLIPAGRADQDSYLTSLGMVLSLHADATDDQASADEALSLFRRAAAALPDASPLRAARLSDLSAVLRDRFERSGDPAALSEAVRLAEQAVDSAAAGDLGLPRYLLNLCAALQARWGATDDRADLEEAVRVGRRMLEATPDGHTASASFLSVFGTALGALHAETDQPEDLDEAIAVQRRAVAALPAAGYRGGAGVRYSLGAALKSRFDRAGGQADLDEAIAVFRDATRDAPDDSPVAGGLPFFGLGEALRTQYERSGRSADLAEAIAAMRAALGTLTAAHATLRPMYQAELSKTLQLWFESTGDGAVLDEAVTLAREAAEASPAGSANAGFSRTVLGGALQARRRAGGDQAADADSGADPAADSASRAELSAAMSAHVDRIEQAGLAAALDERALADARALEGLLSGDETPDLHALGLLGDFHWARFRALPGEPDGDEERWYDALDAAIRAYSPLFIAGRSVPARLRQEVAVTVAENMFAELNDHVFPSGDVALVAESVRLWRRICDAFPADDPDRAPYAGMLGTLLGLAAALTGDSADLDESIAVLLEATAAQAGRQPSAAGFHTSLSEALRARFLLTGDPADLDLAIDAARQAVELSAGEPEHETLRAQLGLALFNRYFATSQPGDLDAGIAVLSRAAETVPDDQPARGSFLAVLSEGLRLRFELTGDLTALDQAVGYGSEAVDVVPAGLPDWATAAAALGNALMAQAAVRGEPGDIDRAIGLFGQGADASQPGHATLGMCEAGRCGALLTRFVLTGGPADLDSAIEAGERALDALPAGQVGRTRAMGNLGRALLIRFANTASTADHDAAITLFRAAAAETPEGNPDRTMYLSNIAQALQLSFARTGDVHFLDESIDVARQAVEEVKDGHVEQARYLIALGSSLRARCAQTEDYSGLGEAVELLERAVGTASGDRLIRSLSLAELGSTLYVRFMQPLGDPADLDLAVAALREAIAAADGLPAQAEYLLRLGVILDTGYEETGPGGRREEAIDLYARAAESVSASPAFRIIAARFAADLAAETAPGRAADLLEMAVRLLPQAASRQLSRSDQQHQLSEFTFLSNEAAEAALVAGGPDAAARALGLLELARAVLQGQALDIRTDLLELHASHPAMASRFLKLRDRLDAPDGPEATAVGSPAGLARGGLLPGPGGAVDVAAQAADRHRAGREFAALLDQIRGLEGFASFLLPPRPEDLTRHAAFGPIVAFNIGRSRSDALIVTAAGITQVPLPELELPALIERIETWEDALEDILQGQASQRAEATLGAVLEWLWDAAAGPVLRHLGYGAPPAAGQPWPRVWWEPGGLLGMLPVHAAGYHRAAAGNTVLDRVVSSYTPTVRALSYARDRARAVPPRRALLVAMPTTPGLQPLEAVRAEAAMLSEILPSPTLLIEEDDGLVTDRTPTRETVLKGLAEADIVHFSCHAFSHPDDPSRSQIFLHDHAQNPFTVGSLTALRLHRAQLAFLSACQTARSESLDLIDESIHLTSAFQLAGFPHVIGSLWSLWDVPAAVVAGALYSTLQSSPGTLNVNASAWALHQVVRQFRDDGGNVATPSAWAAFIHALREAADPAGERIRRPLPGRDFLEEAGEDAHFALG